MPKYRVIAVRKTHYDIDADDSQHAIDEMIEQAPTPTHEETETIRAMPLCPACGALLTDRTTRTILTDGPRVTEPTYCDTCDREVEF